MSGDSGEHHSQYWDYVSKFIPPQNLALLDVVLDDRDDCERDLLEIAQYITKWEEKLVGPLGLTREEVDTINEVSKQELKRRKVLRVWKDKEGLKATYGCLLDRCLQGKDSRTAQKICEILKQKSSSGHGKSSRDDDDDDDVSNTLVKKNLAKIKGRFSALVTKVTTNLKRKNIDMSELRLYITTLFPPGDIISHASNVAEVCQAISHHQLWDFSSYSPVEEIVKNFGADDPELSEWIKEYKSELAGFKAVTKIAHYIGACSDDEDMADSEQSLQQHIARYDKRYCHKLSVKLKPARVTEKSLDYIDALWRSIADYLYLPSLSVLLETIKEGCVEVTWLVPTLSALQVETNIQDSGEFLKKMEITHVTLDGEVLYSNEGVEMSGMAPSGLPLKKKGFMQKVKNVVKTQFKKLLKKDLWTLSKDGDYEAIKSLLEEGQLDINMKDRSYKDWTPLHYACKYGHFEIVQLLLKNGADIHAKATNNWTALAIACYFNFVRIANLLLKEGAKYNQIIQKNFTPIMIVTSNDRQEDMEPLARTLLKYGADLEIADERGWTPLMNASDIERVNLVRLYLEYGADVNRRADNGWTALMSAAKHDAGEIAGLLIEYGANMELAMIADPKSRKSALEDNALHVASFMGSANVVKELVDHGSKVNKTNADGLTPLMIATNQGNIEVVEGLLKSDALDIDLPHQKTGLPALFIAAKKGYLDIFDILLQHGAKDEVNSISVSEVARLFKKKDQILARLKKFKSIKKTEVSAPEQSPQAAQMEPPQREMTTATSVEAVSVEPVTVEAVSEQAESIMAVPTETKSLTQDMESGAELTTTTKTISVLPMDTESVTAAQQSTDSVTAIPQVTGSVASVQDTDISAVPQTPAAVSQSTESVAAMPQVPAHVQVETAEEAPELKQEAEVQEHPDDETVEGADDTSSLYGDGEEDSSEQKQDQEKRGRIQQQSREEYLKQLLKTWDLVYKSYTDRMSVFTSNNGSEYSGKGVKPVDIQQHYREQTT